MCSARLWRKGNGGRVAPGVGTARTARKGRSVAVVAHYLAPEWGMAYTGAN